MRRVGRVEDDLAAVGAFLVEPRILRRVIRRHRRLDGIALQVLHSAVYGLPRAELLELASPSELDLSEAALPEHPILLPRPIAPPSSAAPFWRKVFHWRVHQALAGRALSDALVRERIHRVGQTEFDEIRLVLRQDELLLPPRDDRETYVEFAALFLELRRFAPADLGRVFPTLLDAAAVEAILAEDVDVAALLAASRPPGAPESPEPAARAARSPAPELQPVAVAGAAALADRARKKGNLAESAVLARRAGDAAAARRDLETLVARLGLDGEERAAWTTALLPLVDAGAAATPGARTVEVRLLYDLVKAAIDRERELADVDVLDWVRSLFRRPLIRALPLARPVRIARHLRGAASKAARAHIGDDARDRLSELLLEAAERADHELRVTLRPRIEAVLDEVGLQPKNVPERVARAKLIAELLDRVVKDGFFNLGHVRDALSSSQLKLPDLSGPLELLRGDPLLAADARLERVLDGVYRRGEIYLRFLQKLSSLFFGTVPGRLLTLYALLPFVGAYVILQGLQHILGPGARLAGLPHPHIFSWAGVGVLFALLLALLHSAAARRAGRAALRGTGLVLHAVFVSAPRAAISWAPVAAILKSRAAALVLRFVIKPAVLAILFVAGPSLIGADGRGALVLGGGAFLLINLILNTRAGAHAEEVAGDYLVRAGRHVGMRVIPSLLRLIIDLFRAMLEYLDRALYAVDERLRFRRGDGTLAIVAKGALGSLWGLITYLIRVYVNLFIEPTVNPVKHFPVVTVAGKIMLPLAPNILGAISRALEPLVGKVAAGSIAAAHLFVLPGFWGFLVWELKENWRLYDRNRPRALGPVVVGGHGETMLALLRPGLHSGTVPKLYARLRRASRRGAAAAAKHRAALHHVEEAVARFVERELGALLAEAGQPAPRVERVEAGGNRLRVMLEPHAVIAFEEQSGWLLGSLAEPGFVAGLEPRARVAFDAALVGLYKLAGVDMVREEIAAVLPPGAPYDIADEGLVVWPDGYQTEVIYDLSDGRPSLEASVRGDPPAQRPAVLEADRLLLSRRELGYASWVERWGPDRPA